MPFSIETTIEFAIFQIALEHLAYRNPAIELRDAEPIIRAMVRELALQTAADRPIHKRASDLMETEAVAKLLPPWEG